MGLQQIEVLALLKEPLTRSEVIRTLQTQGLPNARITGIMLILGASESDVLEDLGEPDDQEEEEEDEVFPRLLVLLTLLEQKPEEVGDLSRNGQLLCQEALEEYFAVDHLLSFAEGAFAALASAQKMEMRLNYPWEVWDEALGHILNTWEETNTAPETIDDLENLLIEVCVVTLDHLLEEMTKPAEPPTVTPEPEAQKPSIRPKPSQKELMDAAIKQATGELSKRTNIAKA